MLLSPTMKKKLRNFRSIKRGYYAFIIISVLFVLSLFAELIANHKALMVKYEGKYYFPILQSRILGKEFGATGSYSEMENEANYKALQLKWKDHQNNFVLMPLIPYGPLEIDGNEYYDNQGKRIFYPLPPGTNRHYLGTDSSGRDIVSRLIYGFRLNMLFALALTFVAIIIGVSVGSLMGYLGGWFDLLFYRVMEVMRSVNHLLVLLILSAIFTMNIYILFCIFLFWEWMSYVNDTRALTFREKTRNYVLSARAMGASHMRIMFKHLIPNTFIVVIVVIPFAINGNITLLTGLDYLGFGLGAGDAMSLGQMLNEGQKLWERSPWILSSAVSLLVSLLIAVTFVGEALRESFDPKKHMTYE